MGKIFDRPRILIFSQRNIFPYALWRCPLYEFEDTICKIDSADVLAPTPGKWFPLGNRIANKVARHSTIALNPGIVKTKISGNYDIFFTICSFPKDLLNLRFQNNWKDCCNISICLVDEMWVNQLSRQECYLKILSKFDFIFMYYSQSVNAVRKLTGKKCFYLPPGVDALEFCPFPNPPKRVIDIYSIGRRSAVTHQSLLQMARDGKMFYVYDSIAGNQSIHSKEHRQLLVNMSKRSRFYVVNPGLIDRKDIRGEQIEIGNRFFEGAASGTVMIGEIPRNDEFGELFGWKDAVVHLPYGSNEVEKVMNEIDNTPELQNNIRRENIVQSLRRHDWSYRWETILENTGFEPLQPLKDRKNKLIYLSSVVETFSGNF